ncbi:MAG: response regulator [Thermoanaerobaculia bacterium]|jgi:signal transduction histidine kinase/DNA-binding response OmpR family regulator
MSAPLKRSIRGKIAAIILLTTTLAVVAGLTATLVYEIRALRRSMVESTRAIARITGEQCVAGLAVEDKDETLRTLGKLSAVSEIEAAWVFDASGAEFTAWRRGGAIALPRIRAGSAEFIGSHLQLSESIDYQGDHYGVIHLAVSTEPLRARIVEHLLVIAGLTVFLVAAASVAALRFERVISDPILTLARATREISERHDYSLRVTKASDDELGDLSEGFNDMLAQIEKRQRERDEADQRTREKSQFLANMSHELRTPLNAIIGFSDILRSRLAGRLSEKEQRFVDNIHSSGEHLLGLVNDILDLSKIEAGRMEMNPERFSIDAAIDGVTSLMRGVSTRRSIALDVVIEPGLPLLVADAVKIKQVLYNLLSNAVKFSPEGSMVSIRARFLPDSLSPLREASIAVSIIDHGIGIDPANHGIVFREFQQVDAGASRQFEGTGLGLALVRKFVEMHQGRIELDSELGKGSTFTIILPVAFHGAAAERTPAPFRIDPADPRPRVLVIEDEESAFSALASALGSTEFAAIWARSGEEGLELARLRPPAAILLDIVLPGVGGWDVLRALKSDPQTRDIPVAIVSMVDNRELGLALGVDAYFTKPVDRGAIVDTLRRLVDGSGGRHDILLIDDDPSFHDLIDAQLEPAGFSVRHARNGAEGLRMIAESAPALVILDLMMEEMDGFEVALRIRLEPRSATIPIMIVTSADVDASVRSRLRGRIEAIVEKQKLTTEQLAATVRRLARKPKGDKSRGENSRRA